MKDLIFWKIQGVSGLPQQLPRCMQRALLHFPPLLLCCCSTKNYNHVLSPCSSPFCVLCGHYCPSKTFPTMGCYSNLNACDVLYLRLKYVRTPCIYLLFNFTKSSILYNIFNYALQLFSELSNLYISQQLTQFYL